MDQYKSRQEVKDQDRWNLDLIYPSLDAWEGDFKKIEALVEKVEKYQGTIGSSAQTLKKAFDEQMDLNLLSEKLYVYAHLLSDQDTRDTTNLGRVDRIRSKLVDAAARLSWIDPELLALPIEQLKQYEQDPLLREHSRRLENLIRSKPHQRSAEVEEILTLASEPTGGGYKTFSLLENADMKMPVVKDGEGKEIEINHGNYITCLESPDRVLRKNAFEGYLSTFGQFKNTIASTLDNHVKKQIFYSRAHYFNSAIEASLFTDAVPLQVYNGLIETVHQHLPLLHRWISLRKKLLGIPDLALYDIFVPMVRPANIEYTYEQAAEMVIKGVQPLGEVYVEALSKAFEERWIDVYYTPGKRSGAYSSGMFQTKPYILLNHKDNLGSAFTLAHELGHSLHSYFSNRTQPYPKADYPIFLAEVASTTNEMLLHHYLYERAETREMKLYLLDHLFNQFRGTLFRQVQFAEFERDIHAMAERGEPLTADSLGSHYAQLNAQYYGEGISQHELIRHEWSRIPHFYYNFYVYKYSTSFAAAQYFAQKIYDGDTDTREKYLNFLKSGSSQDPIDTLIKAGVDLRDSKPIEAAFKVFEAALDEFEKLHG
jgi:oligoendopeptidase F